MFRKFLGKNFLAKKSCLHFLIGVRNLVCDLPGVVVSSFPEKIKSLRLFFSVMVDQATRVFVPVDAVFAFHW